MEACLYIHPVCQAEFISASHLISSDEILKRVPLDLNYLKLHKKEENRVVVNYNEFRAVYNLKS